MSRQIWKFGPLFPGLEWRGISIDEFATVVHFGEQNGNLFFWAEVNPKQGTLVRDFMVIPTGADLPEYGMYHSTLVASDGTVWHLFERA